MLVISIIMSLGSQWARFRASANVQASRRTYIAWRNWLKALRNRDGRYAGGRCFNGSRFPDPGGYGFQVNVVNARHTKTLPGRKTDVLECANGCKGCIPSGLLNNSFRPPRKSRS